MKYNDYVFIYIFNLSNVHYKEYVAYALIFHDVCWAWGPSHYEDAVLPL